MFKTNKRLTSVIGLLLLILLSCSSENEHLITGKWQLAGRMIGGTPSSFWFKWNGIVIAPWEDHSFAMISEGTYEFIDNRHIKMRMDQGYYKGNVFNFEIMELSEHEMFLGSNYEEIRLKKVQE